MTSQVLETQPRLAPGPPGGFIRRAHYVRKTPLGDAVVFGQELEALCGYRWIPCRDPEKYPLCQVCKEIYDGLPG